MVAIPNNTKTLYCNDTFHILRVFSWQYNNRSYSSKVVGSPQIHQRYIKRNVFMWRMINLRVSNSITLPVKHQNALGMLQKILQLVGSPSINATSEIIYRIISCVATKSHKEKENDMQRKSSICTSGIPNRHPPPPSPAMKTTAAISSETWNRS